MIFKYNPYMSQIMDRISRLVKRRASWPMTIAGQDSHLPTSRTPRSKIRMKTLLSHCFYRRVVVWTFIFLICLSLSFLNPRWNTKSREVLDLVKLRQEHSKSKPSTEENVAIQAQGSQEEEKVISNNPPPEVVAVPEPAPIPPPQQEKVSDQPPTQDGPHWLQYKQ